MAPPPRPREEIDKLTKELEGSDLADVQQVASAQLKLMDVYHEQVLYQATQSFQAALLASLVGLAFFVAAVVFVLVEQLQNVATISLIAGYLTPPFGMNLFYTKGIAPADVTMSDIYRSIGPFIAAEIVVLALVFLFPKLALWLPSLMK